MRDLRLAFRGLRATPVVSCAIVLSLALGIGANTALFTIVNSLLLRALPVPEPGRLVTVSSPFALGHGFKAGAGINHEMWLRMRDRLESFEGGFAWAPVRVDLSRGGEVRHVDVLFTSGGFFDVLKVPALLGRTYTAADDVRGGGPAGIAAVISYGVWQRWFGGAADVIGQAFPIEGVPCTIVGVMPPAFFGIEVGQPFDVALPLEIEPMVRGARISLHDPRALMLTVMLRLKSSQSLDAATSALRARQSEILGMVNGTLPRGVPQYLAEPFVLVPAATGTADRSGLRRRFTRPLLTLAGVVALVLLLACVNIANLLMARASSRRHEMSVRIALGASRSRLVRQLLVESLLLSTAGALAALLFSRWASHALLRALSTAYSPVLLPLPVDWFVVAVTAAAAIATALLFGVAPALRATRVAPVDALKDGGRVGTSRMNVSSALVVMQVALSVMLLVAAGLFAGTLRRLANVPLGFDSNSLLVVDVDTARAHTDHATRLDYYVRLAEAMAAVPGVAGAAASTMTPFGDGTRSPLFEQPGRIHEHAVTPGFFATYGIRLSAGRDFRADDSAQAGRVVIVSESYVAKYFPAGSALGATLDPRFGCDARRGPCTIVGIVGDAVFGSARGGARPTVYLPLAQSEGMVLPGRTVVSISVRSANGPPAQLSRGLASALAEIDPRLSFSFRALEQDVNAALAQERALAMLSGFFGGLALLLSAVGMYGIASYAVTCRTIEIGIRLALGAARARVAGLVLARLAGLLAVGLALGGTMSLWASRFVGALLYGVDPGDPATLALATAALALTSVLAALPAALRAAVTDPAAVLRRG